MGLLSKVANVFSLGANRAAENAGEAQVAGQRAARGDIERYLKEATGYLAPYRDLGASAITPLSALLGLGGSFDPSAVTRTPGYDFRFKQGVQALDRSAAARGLLGTGGYGQALSRYGQDYASDEFNNYYTRLASLLNLGFGAAGQSGNYAQTAGSGVANTSIGIGNAQADAALGKAAANQLAFKNALNLGSIVFGGGLGGAGGAGGGGGMVVPPMPDLRQGTFFGDGTWPSMPYFR